MYTNVHCSWQAASPSLSPAPLRLAVHRSAYAAGHLVDRWTDDKETLTWFLPLLLVSNICAPGKKKNQ